MATLKRKKSKGTQTTMADVAFAPPAVSASRAIPKSQQVLESIRIEAAANGFTVTCNHSGKQGEYLSMGNRKPMVFDNVDATLAYVGKELRAAKGVKTSGAPKKSSASKNVPSTDGDDDE